MAGFMVWKNVAGFPTSQQTRKQEMEKSGEYQHSPFSLSFRPGGTGLLVPSMFRCVFLPWLNLPENVLKDISRSVSPR